MKILIVEDEKISQVKMKTILSAYGVCEVTSNGLIAVEMFKKAWEQRAPFDVITLDITLQELDGMEVLGKIREAEQEMKVPPAMAAKVVMVTSRDGKDYVTASLTLGANGYIVKPFSDKTVTGELRQVFLKHINGVFPQ